MNLSVYLASLCGHSFSCFFHHIEIDFDLGIFASRLPPRHVANGSGGYGFGYGGVGSTRDHLLDLCAWIQDAIAKSPHHKPNEPLTHKKRIFKLLDMAQKNKHADYNPNLYSKKIIMVATFDTKITKGLIR